jgi:hypothetical protein
MLMFNSLESVIYNKDNACDIYKRLRAALRLDSENITKLLN